MADLKKRIRCGMIRAFSHSIAVWDWCCESTRYVVQLKAERGRGDRDKAERLDDGASDVDGGHGSMELMLTSKVVTGLDGWEQAQRHVKERKKKKG